MEFVAKWLDETFNGQTKEGIYLINIIIGLLSSIVDNVPLVAGAMGMYDIGPISTVAPLAFPQDHAFWEFLAYYYQVLRYF